MDKEIGTTISLEHEINIKGPGVRSRGIKGNRWPDLTTSTPDTLNSFAAMLPTLKGMMPVSAGRSGAGSLVDIAAMGSLCAAVDIDLTPASGGTGYLASYANVLQRLMNGAYVQGASLDEEKLRNMIMGLISAMLEKAGPGFTSCKQVLEHLMQNATLQDFMKGVQAAVCALVGDPVNANTGNFIYEKEDLIIKGRIPLNFKRFYNSINIRSGTMGIGWRHNYEIRLFIEQDRYVILWEDGREEVYLRDKENGPEPLFGLPCRLKQEKEDYLYETQSGLVYTFNFQGRLLKQEDPNGQGLWFTYDKEGRLIRVVNSEGASLHYEYKGLHGLLWHVSDHTGRHITLAYELERLKEVENPNGESYSYTYGPDNRISSIRNPRGIYVLRNSYDDKGRTILQRFADGGKIQYDYKDDRSRTLVTEQNGNKVVYVHDERFRNIKTIYVDGEESFTYNERNQLVSKIDKNGNRTKFSYDDKGNTTQIIFPDGARYCMTYDASNYLITMSINGVQKIKKTYDPKGNLIKITDALGRCRKVEYDEKGNALKIMLPDGSEIALGYDDHGNISQIIDPSGHCTAYGYDSCGRVIYTIDRNGNRTRFVYDACDRIIGVINANGYRRTYEYTQNGKLMKVTDFNGAVTTQEYNDMGQVKSLTKPDGGTTCMEYDLMQNLTKKILPNGAEISYEYDNLNHMEQMSLPTGGKVRYEYDAKGNRTAIIDPEGNRTSMEYDVCDRLTKVTDPSGASKTYKYDLDGFLICVTNAVGKTHTYVYDKVGNIISETDISGNTVSYEYNELNRLTCITDPKKRKTIYEYAPGGMLLKTIYPNGTFETYTYDKNGNRIRRQNHRGDFLEITYDCLNRPTTVKNSFGQKVGFTYDANGVVTSITDPLGHVTHYDHSLEGKLTSIVDAIGNRIEYAYDVMGKLVAVCQHQGKDIILGHEKNTSHPGPSGNGSIHYTYYKRDMLGNVETITNSLGSQEHYSYDLSGRMISKRDREGYDTRYTYNPVGDIESVTYADGRSVIFTYDPLHQLTEIQDWLGTTRIELDDMGRAKSITDYKGRTTSYQWGTMGEREALIYSNGKKVTYKYDELSRLTELTDGVQKIQYYYNEDGLLSKKVFPDGIVSCYQYDLNGFLSDLVHQKNGEVLEQYKYEYDHMCNKTGIHKKRSAMYLGESVTTEQGCQIRSENSYYEYKYDSLNRLTEVWKNRKKLRSYEYDAFGNRVKKRTEKGIESYYYNAANQLVGSEGISHKGIYQYDARGNMTAICQGGEVINRYVYDEAGRLKEAFNANGEVARYEYDGLGNRIGIQEYLADKWSFDSISFSGLVCPENLVKEVDYYLDLTKQYQNILTKTEITRNGTTAQDYTWDFNAACMREEENAYIYLQDEMGSMVRLIGIENKRHIVYDYDEFGQEIYGTQRNIQPFGFTGYQKDHISDLYYANAREYLPQVGRFASEDPIRGKDDLPKCFNAYDHCFGNPLTWVDLDGMEASFYEFRIDPSNPAATVNPKMYPFVADPSNAIPTATKEMADTSTYIMYTDFTLDRENDMSNPVRARAEELVLKGQHVELGIVTNASDFKDLWDQVDDEANQIVNVEVFTHGRPYCLIFREGSSTNALSYNGKNSAGDPTDGDVRDLVFKEIDNLYLNSCNAGHLDFYNGYNKNDPWWIQGNLASEFSKKVEGNVYGFDGNVSYNFLDFNYCYPRLSKPWSQDTYHDFAMKGNFPTGQHIFRNGKLVCEGAG